MSSKTQELVYGITGQLLVWDCPEGRPSAVTDVQIFAIETGDDGTEQTAPASNTVEAGPNTTFDAASGDSETDRTKCNLTATTGCIVGRTYLATNALSEKEWIQVKAISAGSYILATSPLKNDFAAADSFVSTRITSTINSTWIAETGNISDGLALHPGYRVRWTYVVDSTTYVHDSYFDVVRYAWIHNVTEADMRAYSPNWDDRLPTQHREDGGARLIDRASTDVKFDLKRAGVEASAIRHAEGRNELIMARVARKIEAPGTDAWIEADDHYRELIDGLVRVSVKVPIATDTTGAGHQTYSKGIWSK